MSGVLEAVSSKVQGVHLDRGACVYVRQSTLQQVRENVQSTERQYGLVERAVELGWARERSEAELHYLRCRMTAGKQAKARKGELRLPLPVGYVYDEAGAVVQDPDEEVREAVAGLFRTFRQTGSAYATMKALADHPFPKRAYGGAWAGQVLWGSLKHGRACSMLKNPTYAGVYAFGRFRKTKEVSVSWGRSCCGRSTFPWRSGKC